MQTLNETLNAIRPIDPKLETEIQAHLDDLTKPKGSLGRLEELARRYCLAIGTAKPVLPRKRICCFAGDHGVAAEGVSAYPKEVTPQMVMNMLGGGAAINALARQAGAGLEVVDVGIDADLSPVRGLIVRKVRRGTSNIVEGPAMTLAEAVQAVEVGIERAAVAAGDGIGLLGSGDMGIANTTPSTALFCAFLGCAPDQIVGRGTGVDDRGLARKVAVIQRALDVNRSRLSDPLGTLAALGGLEIAAIAGLALGGAARRIPVVVDGFISTAGALAAIRLCPAAADYLFFGHLSEERGHRAVMEAMAARPVLSLGMRLGEGTGAALGMMVIEASLRAYTEMATFSGAGVSRKAE